MSTNRNVQRRGFFVALILLFVFVFALLPLKGLALSSDEIKDKMYEYIQSSLGYAKDEYRVINFVSDQSQTGFSAMLNEYPSTSDGLIIGAISPDGELLDIRGPQELDIATQMTRDLGSMHTPEDAYAFKAKWEAVLDTLDDPAVLTGIHKRYALFIHQNISLPDERSIPIDTAWRAAKKELAALPGWSEAMVELFEMILQVHYTPADAQNPVYQFLWNRHDPMGERYRVSGGKNAYEAYEKELYAAFGNENRTTPVYISVMIDAYTGALYEPPIMECPPVESFYLDFFLR